VRPLLEPDEITRGLPPRFPGPGATRGTGRATLALGVVMVGWVFFLMALAAFGGVRAAASRDPVARGGGVTVTPAAGWSSAADDWGAGPNQAAFQRAGAVAVFVADSYEGDADALLEEQLADLDNRFGSLRTLPAATITIAGDLPAKRVMFTGVSQSARLDGEVAAASRGGVGVVMLALAPAGQLQRAQDDLDEMLARMVVP